jgi:hexosaminidase
LGRIGAAVLGLTILAAACCAAAQPVLMPQPRSVSQEDGALPLGGPFKVKVSGCRQPLTGHAVARFQADVAVLRHGMRASGPGPVLKIGCADRDGGYLTLDAKEAYGLAVRADGVAIDAQGPEGVLRALATLRQLIAGSPGALPLVRIDDAPRFAWRGVMIDSSRHFMSVAAVKRQIDAMERVKLDVLHLHLSDNEGFRVESKLYPKLTAVDAPGEFYTQGQIRGLVAYAAERGVRIVPEFDVPAHTGAIVRAYPELAAKGPPNDPFVTQNLALNPASEATYAFLDRLLGEMTALFPDTYVHVGGDEVSDAAWSADEGVQAFMKANNIAGRVAMEAWFHARVRKMLEARGKRVIGWDEIAATPIPKDVTVQVWRTSNAIAAAVATGHPTVVSAGYYLDLLNPVARYYAVDPLDLQADGFTAEEVAEAQKENPLAGAAAKGMALQPLPPLTPDQEKLVLGGEMELWAELIDDDMIDMRLWPRAAALAERFWSPASVRDPDALQARLPRIENQLEALGLQVDQQQWRAAQRLSPAHAPVVSTFLETVEPTRNHAHNHTIVAMLRGNAHPPPQALTGLADAALTDGPQVRRFELQVKRLVGGDGRDAATLRATLMAWRDNDAQFREIAKGSPDLEAGLPASADTAELASEGLEALDAIQAHRPLSAESRARAAVTLERARKFEAASSRPLFSFMRPQPPGDLILAIAPGVGWLVEAAR